MLNSLRQSPIWFAFGMILAAGCGRGEETGTKSSSAVKVGAETGSTLRIVTTVGMVTDIVREVVGDRGEVIGLLSEGIDPHLYKPTREDVQQLSSAEVIFYGGLMLEGRMDESLKKLRVGKPVVGVSESLDPANLRKPPEFDGHFDPHVWMDVKLWSQCVDAVTTTMRERDPDHMAEFNSRAKAYQQKLAKLDDYVRQSIQSIPEQQRVLVTAHDAFGYFARAYGMEVKSVQGISTESEAGVADVNALVDFLVDRKIGAIFVESSVSDKGLKAVIEGAGKRELFSDAMGTAGTYEGTYVGMIDHNATTITRALGGKAPSGGFQTTEEQP
ncbi:MAG: manganese/zinc/iron transport system substrate-binding protein [Planctomycetota bacterium]|nr:MAG: manganese/zinc/iron transport system substrate-binding protein [Planctomycetota bacterium]